MHKPIIDPAQAFAAGAGVRLGRVIGIELAALTNQIGAIQQRCWCSKYLDPTEHMHTAHFAARNDGAGVWQLIPLHVPIPPFLTATAELVRSHDTHRWMR